MTSCPQAEHSVIRIHPVTGRNALFVNHIFATRIVQLTRHESNGLLSILLTRPEQPQFQCRFKWQPNSIAFWDNRCTQRNAMWDYYPHRRLACRVTIKGDTPFHCV